MTPFEQVEIMVSGILTGESPVKLHTSVDALRAIHAAWTADRAEIVRQKAELLDMRSLLDKLNADVIASDADAFKWRKVADEMAEALKLVSRKCEMSAEVIRDAERTKATGTMAVVLGKIANGHERIGRFAVSALAAFNEAKE
jgi:hypothetical protein